MLNDETALYWPRLIMRRWAVLTGVFLLAGCVATPIVFDRANLASIQNTGVLTPGFPDRPTVAVLPPTNGALFLIVNGVQEGNRSREFAEFLSRAGVNPEAEFSRALYACLGDAGVRPSPIPTNSRRTALLKEYGTASAPGTNAVLDVVVTRYGYYAVTNAAPFQPTATMQARLVDAQSRRVLMEETINMVNVAPADPTMVPYSFQDYSDISANPNGAARALQSAMVSAASAVCRRLT